MVSILPFIIIEEVKRRICIFCIVLVTTLLVVFCYNLNFLNELLSLNYLLYFKFFINSSKIYYYDQYEDISTISMDFDLNYFFYYPEQEYNFEIKEIYNYLYLFEFILIFLLMSPYFLYQLLLFIRPALYYHEQLHFKVIFYIASVIVINLLISLYLTSYVISISNTAVNSDMNSTYYINLNVISLYSYYIFFFASSLFLCVYYFILLRFYSRLLQFVNTISFCNTSSSIIWARVFLILIVFYLFIYLPISILFTVLIMLLILHELIVIYCVQYCLSTINNYYYTFFCVYGNM